MLGALIAVPVLLAVILAALYAASAVSGEAALQAERGWERLTLIPLVNSSGVYALIVNSGTVDSRILYLVSRDLDNGSMRVEALNATLAPGASLEARVWGPAARARLAAYAVTELGDVFPWDPLYTGGDSVLDIPGEPTAPGGSNATLLPGVEVNASVDALQLVEWLISVLGEDYPGACILDGVYNLTGFELTVASPFNVSGSAQAYAVGGPYGCYGGADAEASIGNLSRSDSGYMLTCSSTSASAELYRTGIPLGPLWVFNRTLGIHVLSEAGASASPSLAEAEAYVYIDYNLTLEPVEGYYFIVVYPGSAPISGRSTTVSYGGRTYTVALPPLIYVKGLEDRRASGGGRAATASAGLSVAEGEEVMSIENLAGTPWALILVYRCP